MPSVPTPLFINSTVPAAPSGSQNVKPQQDGGNPDSVSFYVPNIGGVDPRTTATETIALASQGKLVTLTYATAIAVALNSGAVAAGFFCAVAVLGAGTATLTPSSGTINGVASLALSTGQGGWLFYDGANWEAISGGGIASVVKGGTGVTAGATIVTNGTAIAPGTSQAQPDASITGVTTASVGFASLDAAPDATWQTGIFWITQASAGKITVYLVNPTAASITPVAANLNVRAIL